jgi:hypothetical protein
MYANQSVVLYGTSIPANHALSALETPLAGKIIRTPVDLRIFLVN